MRPIDDARLPALDPPQVPAERPGAVGGKRDANRRRRIQQVCDAAIPLFLEHGINAVTIDQIVAAAGIAKGSFYRYFHDKTQLVETLFEPMATVLAQAMENCRRSLLAAERGADLQRIYEQFALDIAEPMRMSRSVIRLYLQECRGPRIGSRIPVRAIADDVARRGTELSSIGAERGMLRPGNPVVETHAVIGAIEQLVFAFFQGEELGRRDEIPRELISLILDGVRR